MKLLATEAQAMKVLSKPIKLFEDGKIPIVACEHPSHAYERIQEGRIYTMHAFHIKYNTLFQALTRYRLKDKSPTRVIMHTGFIDGEYVLWRVKKV